MLNKSNQKLNCSLAMAGLILSMLSSKAQAISNSDAAAQVANTLGRTFVWTSIGKGQSCHRDAINLDGTSASASVDNQTGILIKYIRKDFSGTQIGQPTLTLNDAQGRATTFLQNVGISAQNSWSQPTTTYLDHGTGWRDYAFSWRRVVQGVRLPSSVDVTIDADSGEVRSYMLIDDTVTISIAPSITANNAAIAVAQNQNIANPVIQSTILAIWYHPVYFDYTTGQAGLQTLYWEVTLQNPNVTSSSTSTIVARVDANTGSIETILETPAALHHQSSGVAKNQRTTSPGCFAKKRNGRWIIVNPLPNVDVKALRFAKIPLTVFQLASLKMIK